MDVNLSSLIEKIKKDGVEEAEQQSKEIVNKAKKDASDTLAKAKKDAEKIVQDAEKQAAQFKENAESDIKQSVRDAELLLKQRFEVLFDNVFKHQVNEALKPEFVKDLLIKIVEGWSKGKDVEVVLNEKDKAGLEKLLFAGLKKELKDTVTIKISHDIGSGFRVGLKDGDVHYDFSGETIALVLKSMLSPNLQKILDK
ncbi:hypothetical protein JW935_01060 [candidate division KSB1 bacterium]|nr:hypothetical protein [candidate division KSB1 bacterium]